LFFKNPQSLRVASLSLYPVHERRVDSIRRHEEMLESNETSRHAPHFPSVARRALTPPSRVVIIRDARRQPPVGSAHNNNNNNNNNKKGS